MLQRKANVEKQPEKNAKADELEILKFLFIMTASQKLIYIPPFKALLSERM